MFCLSTGFRSAPVATSCSCTATSESSTPRSTISSATKARIGTEESGTRLNPLQYVRAQGFAANCRCHWDAGGRQVDCIRGAREARLAQGGDGGRHQEGDEEEGPSSRCEKHWGGYEEPQRRARRIGCRRP